MPNPIDSENVIAWLNVQIEKVQGGWLHDYCFPTNVIAALTDVKRFVKDLPTIEAEPVRHGRWILCEDQHGVDNDNNNYAYFCSQCHHQDVHSKFAKVNFCWNCGARMDAEDINVLAKDGGADSG